MIKIIYDMKNINCIYIRIEYIINMMMIEMDSRNSEIISNFEDTFDLVDDADELRYTSVSTG